MNRLFGIFWRSLIVGLVYAATPSLSGRLLPLVGLHLPAAGGSQVGLLWLFVGGAIAGLFLGPMAASLPALGTSHILIWASVVFFNLASVMVEGRFFAPQLVAGSLPGLLLQQLLAALAAAWAITALFASKATTSPAGPSKRSWFSWAWRFVVSALSYLVFYFIFGALNYALVTKPYYETHAGGLTAPAPQVVLMAELIRAPLIVLSVLPFLLKVHADKKRLAVQTGLILFAVGGLLPLTLQVTSLPLFLLAASAVEILLQNFSTGLVTGRLLGRSE